MKSIIIVLVINFLSTLSLVCQSKEISGSIIYNVSLNSQRENLATKISSNNKLSNLEDNTKNDLMKLINDAKDVEIILNFNQNKSSSQLLKTLNIDSNKSINVTKFSAGASKKYYTELGFNSINLEQNCEALGKCFLITNNRPKWQLINDKKIIDGFTCYKASSEDVVSKSIVTAWYTTEIPIAHGPKHFYGLPGLILELNDNVVTFVVKKINFTENEESLIEKPTIGKTITRKEFDDLLKTNLSEFYKN